tara:strand:+ start:13139 stop:13831 length:693 start_codon:yes stop_codon:yes gene_type:complete
MNKNYLLNKKDNRILQLADVMQNVMAECKNPLNNIYTISSGVLLNSEIGLSDEHTYKSTLITINENIKNIINSINYFDIFLSDKEELKTFNINNALQNVISMHNQLLKKYKISVKTNYLATSHFTGYENELTQIFTYTLSTLINILKKRQKSESIIIKTRTNQNNTKITIRVTNGDLNEFPLDLGLYISKKIIEEHYKGEIIIENERFEFEGKKYQGMKFIIIINNSIVI